MLCACLLAGVLCCPVSAEKESLSLREQVIADAKMSYQRSLQSAGKESFLGFCGLMTSHQLYNLKINTTCIVNDGNKQYDYYLDVPVTTGGYYTIPYGAEQYDLRSALNAVSRGGTKDVRNILVCFQWTSTESGSQFGHAFLINGILDGVCYFVESFDFSTVAYHKEGTVVAIPIDEVADYFQRWTIFEGLIHFGSYVDSCREEGTDAMVMARFDSCLRTQPGPVGQDGCQRVRPVAAGERLRATAIATDQLGQQFYRVLEDGLQYYIAADAVAAMRVNPEDMSIFDPVIPQQVRALEDADISGLVVAQNGNLAAVEVLISDYKGTPVMRERLEVSGDTWDIAALNEELSLDLLDPGSYALDVYADCANPVLVCGKQELRYGRARLWSETFVSGGDFAGAKGRPAVQSPLEQTQDGWVLEPEGWYYYQQGRVCFGWVELCGVRYYLDRQGKALTGWQELDGKLRFFSDTGALVRGCELERDGVMYTLDDKGVATAK